MRPLLLSSGDPAGVGPEVAVRAAATLCGQERVVVFGDGARLHALAGGVPLVALDDPTPRGLSIVDTGRVSDAVVSARAPTADGGRAQLAALDAAIDWALAGRGRAVITAPTSKAAVERAGVPFVGQTEHLARRCGLADDAVTMMFLGPRLRVALATTHVSIRRLPDVLAQAHVERAIEHLVDALERLSTDQSRVAHVLTSALNPHAGEEGLFGSEDADVIAPAVREASRRLGPRAVVQGPIGAETAFRRAASAEVDGVVAMFHDQATIASKLLDWGDAVNVTWGLPFVRTSVDHGVAYDAAAAGTARDDGMRAALRLAALLTKERR